MITKKNRLCVACGGEFTSYFTNMCSDCWDGPVCPVKKENI